ncbi:CHASE2 domain-containing protein [Novosphingobium gossypii]|uniref:CHASE2 domain-containing protein n=1 Tax=Novosphingobium gossypii TaxID=1604774 RepID=UPI003D21106D
MKPWRHLRLRTQWWWIVVVTSLLVVVMTMDRTMERFDNAIYDHLLQFAPAPSADANLLVEIDDDSIGRIGRWPWNRAVHAALVDRLNAAGAKAIGYDVLFTEPTDAAGDSALARAMGRGAPVFLPVLPSATAGVPDSGPPLLPIPIVRGAAAGLGAATVLPDPDGVVRTAMLPDRFAHQTPHLADVMARSPRSGLSIAGRSRLIPFGGGTARWPEVSASAILTGQVPAELVKDRIVLVGVTASGLGSRYATPAGGVMSGLEIQAYLLQGLRSGAMMARAGPTACLALALLPAWLLMLALGPFRWLPALTSLALCAALVLGLSIGALMLLRIWLPPSTALAGLAVAYPIWGWRQLAATERFMRAQLERLQEEPALIPQPIAARRARGVAGTIELLHVAIARHRQMRHFVADRLDQLPDATVVTDLEGTILLANVAARRLFAAPVGALEDAGGISAILRRCRPTGSGDVVRFPPIEEAAACEVQFHQGPFLLVGIAGQTSAEGARVGWVIRFVDVSEAKAAQKQRDDVVQLLTHDMRSPQASILAVLETATEDRISERESTIIRHYAERTLQLADGFVQLARAENLEYALEQVDLGDMLMDAIDELWPQSKTKTIGIVTHTDDRLEVTVERSLMTRALVNVIGNAIKYSAQGTTINCSLFSTVQADGATWAICAIEDQGPGIEPALRQTIFERFRRGPAGLGSRTSGAGLGLSFVHTVMVRHNGHIECRSEPGLGTAFLLKLPVQTGGVSPMPS